MEQQEGKGKKDKVAKKGKENSKKKDTTKKNADQPGGVDSTNNSYSDYSPGQLSLLLTPSAQLPTDIQKLDAPKAFPTQKRKSVGGTQKQKQDKHEDKKEESKEEGAKDKAAASEEEQEDEEDGEEEQEDEEERLKRTLFVGNVPADTKKKQLIKLFSSCGPIDSLRIRSVAASDPKLPKRAAAITKDFHPSRDSWNAYLVFVTEEGAKEGLKLNGSKIGTNTLRVDFAGNSAIKSKQSVFIGNLPQDTKEEGLREAFGKFGEIDNVRVVRDPLHAFCKGIAFVVFKDGKSVKDALTMHEAMLFNRKIRVFRAQPPAKMSKGAPGSRGGRGRGGGEVRGGGRGSRSIRGSSRGGGSRGRGGGGRGDNSSESSRPSWAGVQASEGDKLPRFKKTFRSTSGGGAAGASNKPKKPKHASRKNKVAS